MISNNLGGAVYVSYKDILLFGFGTLNGGALYANRNVYLGGNFNITYDESTVDHGFSQHIVSNWSVK